MVNTSRSPCGDCCGTRGKVCYKIHTNARHLLNFGSMFLPCAAHGAQELLVVSPNLLQ